MARIHTAVSKRGGVHRALNHDKGGKVGAVLHREDLVELLAMLPEVGATVMEAYQLYNRIAPEEGKGVAVEAFVKPTPATQASFWIIEGGRDSVSHVWCERDVV